MSTLEDSYAYCQDAVHKGDVDRFHAALFARDPARRALLALYAFHLELVRAASLTREPMLGEIRLQWWREVMDEIYAGRLREHPVVRALAETIRHHALPRAALDAMIDARSFDLDEGSFATRAEFSAYAGATAGSAFALGARILDPERAGAFEAIAQLAGEAHAGAGLLRALPFHAQRRKLFLSEDILAEAHVEREDIFARRMSKELRNAIAFAAKDAASSLNEARKMLRAAGAGEALPAFLPLALVAARLRRISSVHDIFEPREEPQLFMRQGAMLGAALRGRV